METKDIEKCKIKQKEYQTTIRNIDLKIVENNIKIYNLLECSDKQNNEEIKKINNEIKDLELQKKQETDNMMLILKEIKSDIQDVYFDLDKIKCFVNNNKVNQDNSIKISEMEYLNQVSKNKDINKQNTFNIKTQRIIDFENFFKSINNISNKYIKEIEEIIDEDIKEKRYLEETDELEYKSEKIFNQFILNLNTQVEKFKKDENIVDVSFRVQEINKNNKDIELKIKKSEEEAKELKEKLDSLQDIYFVSVYAKKIIKTFLNMQLKKEIKNNENKADDEIYSSIKKIAKKNRIANMIKIDKWSNELITKVNKSNIKESKYEVIISIIRKGENNCNIQLERILNSIILLCDKYINLENVEIEDNARKKVLAQNMSVLMVLSKGIENIKKKYSKIPIIGRKISYILEPKLIDIK